MEPIAPPQPDPLAGMRPRRWAARLLGLCGWTLSFPPPVEPKVLIIAYPHTSNWDFLWGLLACWAEGWPICWIAKHTLFHGPMGVIMRRWGGIPVNRQAPGGFIEGLTGDIARADTLLLAIAPEGTRRYVEHWKSGFLRLARAADLPLGLAYIDYRARRIGIAEYMRLSDDEATDMAHIASAYASIQGRNPAQAGPVRLGARDPRHPHHHVMNPSNSARL